MLDRRAKILVADDDPVTLNLIIGMLELDGYRLVVARNSAEATQLALAEAPDLLLLDVLMPDGGGFEVCAALRREAPDLEFPVIFLTGLDQADQIEQGFAMGAIDYITKPFTQAQLRSRVRTWLMRLGKHVTAADAPSEGTKSP
jgi:putative two-component system response regulator